MPMAKQLLAILVMLAVCGCSPSTINDEASAEDVWKVIEVDIEFAHSNSTDAATGFSHHDEICAAHLESGGRVLYLAYRPSDYANRNPGISAGDRIELNGLDEAKDTGYTDERDVWIGDITFKVVP